MPLSQQELSIIQLKRIERTEIKSLKSQQQETDEQEEEALGGVKKKLARLEKKQLELQRHVKSDTSLEPQIERLQEQIVVTERRIRARQSARTVAQSQLHRSGRGHRWRYSTSRPSHSSRRRCGGSKSTFVSARYSSAVLAHGAFASCE